MNRAEHNPRLAFEYPGQFLYPAPEFLRLDGGEAEHNSISGAPAVGILAEGDKFDIALCCSARGCISVEPAL